MSAIAAVMSDGYFDWTFEEGVSTSARSYFDRHGFAIFRSFTSDSDVSALRCAADKIIYDPEFATPANAIFTTEDQSRKMDDAYFLDSASTIRCFREEKSRPLDNREGAAFVSDEEKRSVEINKIGHALHDLNPVFAAFSYSESVRRIARGFGLCSNPLLIQSMYIFKQPVIGAPVHPHRDATFIISDPDTCLGLWWALEDSTVANGCLWAVPGSHRDGVHKRFVLNPSKRKTEFHGVETVSYAQKDYVSLPMRRGDLIVLHGALMHMSLENKSACSRQAYSIHLVDSQYSEKSWLQRPENMPFRSLNDPPPCIGR